MTSGEIPRAQLSAEEIKSQLEALYSAHPNEADYFEGFLFGPKELHDQETQLLESLQQAYEREETTS